MDEFENVGGNEEREPNADIKGGVHHYHAHDKDCNDMGHCLHVNEHGGEGEHSVKHGEAKMPSAMNEHTEPEEIKDREEVGHAGKGSYPGFIRKLR